MTWYQSVFELIDMRSFSNLWFWIMLAVLWSSTSHWVLGVPWDMVTRARKEEAGQGVQDLHDLIRINTNRILYIADTTGILAFGFACFALTVAVMLGFVYAFEFGQAIFLLGLPMSIVAMLSVRTSRIIQNRALQGEDLYKRMHIHRVSTQFIGMLSIFVTAMWGMFQNLTVGALGG